MRGRDVAIAGIASVLFGVIVGLSRPTLQVVVETGQVLSGRVEYPEDHGFGRYHRLPWSLPNQATAALLRCGLSENAASLLWTALVGAASHAAIGLILLAASGDVRFSVAGLPLAAWLAETVTPSFQVAYPIAFAGTTATYGVFGAGWGLAALALVAIGTRRTGFVFLGLGPAVHPAIGTATLLAGTVALAVERGANPAAGRPWGHLAAGLLLSAGSFALQSLWKGSAPPIPEPGDLEAWWWMILHVDYHRRAIAWSSALPATLLVAGTIGAVLRLHRRAPQETPDSARCALLELGFLAAGGLVGVLLTHVRELLPAPLMMAMPGRYANLAMQFAVPLAVGAVLGRMQGLPAAAGFVAGILFAAAVQLDLAPFPGPTTCCLAVALLLVLAGTKFRSGSRLACGPRVRSLAIGLGLCLALAKSDESFPARVGWTALGFCALLSTGTGSRSEPTMQRIGWLVATGGLAVSTVAICVLWQSASRHRDLKDAASSEFWAVVGARPGLLLPFWLERHVQLRSHRPVVVDDSQFNGAGFAYAAPGTMRLVQSVRELYGYDLLDPNVGERSVHEIFRESYGVADRWVVRSRDEWRRLGRKYGFRDVLVPAPLSLELRVVAEGEGFRLWEVPLEDDDGS